MPANLARPSSIRFGRALGLSVAALVAVASAAPAAPSGPGCEKAAAGALRSCIKSVAGQELRCIQATGASCLSTDPTVAKAVAKLETKVLAACPGSSILQAAGYSAVLTPAHLVTRLEQACHDTTATLVARSFGGPHLAVRDTASESSRACLDTAFSSARSMVDFAYKQQSKCLLKAHAGKSCDTARVLEKVADRQPKLASKVLSRCSTTVFRGLTTLDAPAFVSRAAAQGGCLLGVAHGSTVPLSPDCGPRADIVVPARDTATQVVLPSATFGSRCGDGSDYAFWIRLAPEGHPVEKVVFLLQGGGVCYDASTCGSRGADFFEAASDPMPAGGLFSVSNPDNPFRDWTKVYLPYCTQDLFIGGGVTNNFTSPTITVHRGGALNVRATAEYVRDVLWTSMDASDPEGYRPDRVQVLFSGTSAGGFGVAYNYHWMLDDLRWIHTTLVPDSALAMDNGDVGVITIAGLASASTSPGWGSLPYLPPYCSSAECAEIFTTLIDAQSARLKAVPDQQILQVSNQVDNTQKNTTFWATTSAWVNALRTRYCESAGTNGLRSFFSANSSSVHGMIHVGAFNTVSVGGTLLRDWLGGAMTNPDAVTDKVEEGTLVADIAGVLAFPCALP